MCSALNRCVWILVLIVWMGQLVPALSQTEGVVTLNLKAYGWEPPGRREVDSPSIAVDHQGRVIVGFTVRERTGLVTRNQPSLGFRIVRFSPDGKVDLSLSLPTNEAGRTGIYLSDTDQIVAIANGRLQLLQIDHEDPRQGVWKIIAPCPLRCGVVQSVTRRTMLLYTLDSDPPLTLVRFSPQPELRRCGKARQFIGSTEDMMQNYPRSITDESAYFHGSSGVEDYAYRWPLCDYEHRVEMPLHIRQGVLNDGVFIASEYDARKNQGELKVIQSDGRVKFRADLVKHETAISRPPVRGSEHGYRIAVDIATRRGGNQALDISSHITARRIAVYDIEAGKEVASIPANLKHGYHFEFDLSPDGHRLAVLEDDMVRVVDIK
jgi:hypothetical protein